MIHHHISLILHMASMTDYLIHWSFSESMNLMMETLGNL